MQNRKVSTAARLPKPLRARIATMARAEKRTISSMMAILLDEAVASRTASPPLQ